VGPIQFVPGDIPPECRGLLASSRPPAATRVVPPAVPVPAGGKGQKSIPSQHAGSPPCSAAGEPLESGFRAVELERERSAACCQAGYPEARCSSTTPDWGSAPALAAADPQDPVQHPPAGTADPAEKRSLAQATGGAGDPSAADEGCGVPVPGDTDILWPTQEQGVWLPFSRVPGADRCGNAAGQAAVALEIPFTQGVSNQEVATQAEVQLQGRGSAVGYSSWRIEIAGRGRAHSGAAEERESGVALDAVSASPAAIHEPGPGAHDPAAAAAEDAGVASAEAGSSPRLYHQYFAVG